MSASTDLVSLRDKVEQLEAELDRSKIDFDYSVDETKEYKDACGKLQERCNELKGQCAELTLENKRLTRKLNDPNAHFASPAVASQSDEVASLRQQLAEKDQVIATQDEKYQSLLNSIKPIFNAILTKSPRPKAEAMQSCFDAMPKDAAKTLKARQNELALGVAPSDGDADTSLDKPSEKSSGPPVPLQQQNLDSHNSSRTLVTQGATKTPSKGPAIKSKSPDPGEEPSVQGPISYSGVVTSKRAQAPRRGRAGQLRAPISHAVIERQEALRAEKQEEIQSKAGRSQKPNKAGGFQPPQKAAGSSDIKASPAPKQNVTASASRDRPYTADFVFNPDLPSSSVPKEKVVPKPAPSLKGTPGSSSKGQTPSGPATKTDLGKITPPASSSVTNPQIRGESNDLTDIKPQTPPNASVSKRSEQTSHQVSDIGPLVSRQARDAGFPPPARSEEVRQEVFLFGEDDEEPYMKIPAGYVPSFLGFELDAVPQEPNLQESMSQKPVIQEQACQISTKDTMDTAEDAPSWASEAEAQGSYLPSTYDRKHS